MGARQRVQDHTANVFNLFFLSFFLFFFLSFLFFFFFLFASCCTNVGLVQGGVPGLAALDVHMVLVLFGKVRVHGHKPASVPKEEREREREREGEKMMMMMMTAIKKRTKPKTLTKRSNSDAEIKRRCTILNNIQLLLSWGSANPVPAKHQAQVPANRALSS